MKKTLALTVGRAFGEAMTLDEWVSIGNEIYREAESLTWQLADWAAFGDRTFGTLKEFCDKHGLNYSTLRTYAYVAANVRMSNRLDTLSFSHHIAIASLPSREQSKWLAKAHAQNWSVSELRRQLRAGEQNTGSDGPKFHFEDKTILELGTALSSKPDDYWTPDNVKVWRARLKPIVDFYNQRLAPI